MPPTSTPEAAMRTLLHLHDVESRYTDGLGQARETPERAVRAVLRALGAEVAPEPGAKGEDLARLAKARREAPWRRGIDPVNLAWVGEQAWVEVLLPASLVTGGGEGTRCELALEEGGGRVWTQSLASLDVEDERRVDGAPRRAVRLPVPGDLPMGYHRLRVTVGADWHRETLLLVAPTRCWEPPEGHRLDAAWGVFLPLYALRGADGWGAGDLGGLGALMDRTAALGASLVGVLPLLATFLESEPGRPCDPSPYAPVSRRFWNELYLDCAQVPEVHAPEVQALIKSLPFQEELARLRGAELVDYRAAMALKRRVLEAMRRAMSPQRIALMEAWAHTHPEVRGYARFRAAVQAHGADWATWPERLRRGDLRGEEASALLNPEVVAHHVHVQWLAEQQLTALAARGRARGVELYLDLPLGVHAQGYDAWHDRLVYAEGVSTGAPPDAFFTKGQDWGFAPYHPERLREAAYFPWRAAVRHAMRHAGALRVDHHLGLHRLYWVPHGFRADEGAYVRYRHEEVYAVLAVESHRHKCLVIGEDLGTVPKEVRPAMRRHGVQRMHVLQIEASGDPERPLPPPPRDVLSCLNTHDMPTFAGWWRGLDIDDRVAQGLLDHEGAARERAWRERVRHELAGLLRRSHLLEGDEKDPPPEEMDVLHACLAKLASSAARVVLLNLEDLWLEPRPQNKPGLPPEAYPSWHRKAARGLEALEQDVALRAALAEVDRRRRAA